MKSSAKKRILIISIILLIAVVLVIGIEIYRKSRSSYTIDIDAGQVSYVSVFFGSIQKTVKMQDEPDAIRSLIDTLNGSYRYYDKWKTPQASGGGPCSVAFYGVNRSELYQVSFLDNLIYVSYGKGNTIYRYQKAEGALDAAPFLKAVYPEWFK